MKTEITILGRPISKKNSKNVGVNKYNHRLYFTSSEAWKKFEEYALQQLLSYKKYHFKDHIQADYSLFFKGKMFVDFENAIAGLNDVLQASGIIDNDRNIRIGSFKIIEDCEDWMSIIELKQL